MSNYTHRFMSLLKIGVRVLPVLYFYENIAKCISYVLSMSASTLQWQSWVAAIDTAEASKLKTFILCPCLYRKFWGPLTYNIHWSFVVPFLLTMMTQMCICSTRNVHIVCWKWVITTCLSKPFFWTIRTLKPTSVLLRSACLPYPINRSIFSFHSCITRYLGHRKQTILCRCSNWINAWQGILVNEDSKMKILCSLRDDQMIGNTFWLLLRVQHDIDAVCDNKQREMRTHKTKP